MDNRFRDIERRAAMGDKSAQVALLRERVRFGLISEQRLNLAVFLGDETAQQAVGNGGPKGSKYTGRWIRGLIRVDPLAADLVVLTAHQVYAGTFPGLPAPAHNQAPYVRSRWSRLPDMRALVVAAEDWMEYQTDERAERVRALEQEFILAREEEVRLGGLWWGDRIPVPRLTEMVQGRAADVAEECFKTAAEWRNATLSKHGRELIQELMRKHITSKLLEVVLNSGS